MQRKIASYTTCIVKIMKISFSSIKPVKPFWFRREGIISWIPLRWEGVAVYVIYWYDIFATMYYLFVTNETLWKAIGPFMFLTVLYTLLLLFVVHLKSSPTNEGKPLEKTFFSRQG